MIEHNLSVIREADWVIELGPEGGDKGRDFLKRAEKSRNEVLRIIENSLTDDEIEQFTEICKKINELL